MTSCLYLTAPATIRLNRPFFNQWVLFLLGKVTHCIHRFVIPAYFMPWQALVSAVCVCVCVCVRALLVCVCMHVCM